MNITKPRQVQRYKGECTNRANGQKAQRTTSSPDKKEFAKMPSWGNISSADEEIFLAAKMFGWWHGRDFRSCCIIWNKSLQKTSKRRWESARFFLP